MRHVLLTFLLAGCSVEIPDIPSQESTPDDRGSCMDVAKCMLSVCNYQHNAGGDRAQGYVKGCADVCGALHNASDVKGTAARVFASCSGVDDECNDAVDECRLQE